MSEGFASGGKKAWLPEGRGQLFAVALIGLFLIFYIFGESIKAQGLNVEITTVMFLVIMSIGIITIGFMVSKLSNQRTIDPEDWAIIIVALAAVVLTLIYMKGIIPSEFRGAIMSIQSVIGVG